MVQRLRQIEEISEKALQHDPARRDVCAPGLSAPTLVQNWTALLKKK